MPRYRKSKTSKRRYRKRNTKSVKSIKKIVKSVIHQQTEDKHVDTITMSQVMEYNFASNGINLLQGIERGTDESIFANGSMNQKMLGLRIRLRRCVITGSILGANDNTHTNIYRLIVCYDLKPQETPLMLFGDPTAVLGTNSYNSNLLQVEQITSPMNFIRSRYKVLYDSKVKAFSSSAVNYHTFRISIPMKDQVIQYFPTEASFYEGNKKLLFFWLALNEVGTDHNPTIQYYSRVTYEDA